MAPHVFGLEDDQILILSLSVHVRYRRPQNAWWREESRTCSNKIKTATDFTVTPCLFELPSARVRCTYFRIRKLHACNFRPLLFLNRSQKMQEHANVLIHTGHKVERDTAHNIYSESSARISYVYCKHQQKSQVMKQLLKRLSRTLEDITDLSEGPQRKSPGRE